MTKDQINKLLSEGKFPEFTRDRELIETHISWVIIGDQFVYKIKKPIQYSFLDFSTIELRKHFCEKEIELNKRLTEDIYIDVQPIYDQEGLLVIGGNEGKLLDHAVRMNKMDRHKQMDVLLVKNKITETDIRNLAKRIAQFHQNTTIIYDKDFMDIKEKFADLATEKEFLENIPGSENKDIIDHAIHTSNNFMVKNKGLLGDRLKAEYFRDCHGDLHSRNIFLLPSPQPFDCIEFNDDFRQIDVLNEVAFLCMDMDSFDRQDLASMFIDLYNEKFPTVKTKDDKHLFIYYKSYRANVRAKVNSLRARTASGQEIKQKALDETKRYLKLMNHYMDSLQ
jgi:aminoglycoside phosphotransferase family enzyme